MPWPARTLPSASASRRLRTMQVIPSIYLPGAPWALSCAALVPRSPAAHEDHRKTLWSTCAAAQNLSTRSVRCGAGRCARTPALFFRRFFARLLENMGQIWLLPISSRLTPASGLGGAAAADTSGSSDVAGTSTYADGASPPLRPTFGRLAPMSA